VTPIEMVRKREEEIWCNRFESAFAVDETGNVLLDKSGEQYRIDFAHKEVERLRVGRGVVFTHNHPRGWEYPITSLLRAGSSFSDADVEFACRVELIEMRVVTPTRCYFFTSRDKRMEPQLLGRCSEAGIHTLRSRNQAPVPPARTAAADVLGRSGSGRDARNMVTSRC
jgi:hypothetical protein